MLGRGPKEIEIRALGIVTNVDHDEWRVYVNWVVVGLKRKVPLHGCGGSIHGPYSAKHEWVRQVFHL
jgi:hypothetical protein